LNLFSPLISLSPVGVVVQFKDGASASPKELLDHVKPKLAHFKIPDASNIFIWSVPLLKVWINCVYIAIDFVMTIAHILGRYWKNA
jgi:hypothetical protein